MGVGVAVAVAVGAGVLVKVAVGAGVAGRGAARVAGAAVGAATGAQAERMSVTGPRKARARFMASVLLRRLGRPTVGASPALRSAAERRQVEARVGRHIIGSYWTTHPA